MQLRHVVIATDFSPPSVAAARWTIQHFLRDESVEVVLVHAIVVPEPPAFLAGRYPPRSELLATMRAGAESRLAALRHELGDERIRLDVRVGNAVDQIADAAREYGADLVVVGRHGERANRHGRMGSTAEALVGASPAPVLLVTGIRDVRPRRLVVAVDGSDVTPAAMRWSGALSARFAANVIAVNVVSSAVLSHVLTMASLASETPADAARIPDEFRTETDRLTTQLVDAGVAYGRASSEVLFGDPGGEIVAAAERHDADLIVIGRRNAGRVRRAILGSVTAEVLRHAHCPVLVIVEPEDSLLPADVRYAPAWATSARPAF